MGWQRLRDPQIQNRLWIRAKILVLVREFFIKEGFLEVETPILVPAAGQEPYLSPLRTKVCDERGGTREAYLITSPEYAHKKLLAAGFEKTFEITRAFRAGEPWGGLHNPEFTMLEWYRANADYTAIMEDVEKMVIYVIKTSKHKSIKAIDYQGRAIDLSSPWQRLTMAEAWQKYAGIPLGPKSHGREILGLFCRKRGYTVRKSDTYDDLFFKIFLTEIEPKLGFPKPTILYEYPVSMAALARLSPSVISTKRAERARGEISRAAPKEDVRSLDFARDDRSEVAERFELYIAGVELANAFSELTDAREQRRRFIEEQKLRKKLGKAIIPLDEDFLDAVGHLPPSAGIALGVDRLVMLLTDAKSIDEVLTFPANELF